MTLATSLQQSTEPRLLARQLRLREAGDLPKDHSAKCQDAGTGLLHVSQVLCSHLVWEGSQGPGVTYLRQGKVPTGRSWHGSRFQGTVGGGRSPRGAHPVFTPKHATHLGHSHLYSRGPVTCSRGALGKSLPLWESSLLPLYNGDMAVAALVPCVQSPSWRSGMALPGLRDERV